MKWLLLIFILASCSPAYRICSYQNFDQEQSVNLVTATTAEAKYLQKKLSKGCDPVYRNENYLLLYKCHLEKTNIWGRGYIRDIYFDDQIRAQVNCVTIK